MTNALKKLIKLYEWLPVIWNDEDWDYAYFLKLMKYKLSRMERVIGSPQSYDLTWQDRKVELATAQLLIRNVEDDPEDEWPLHWNQYHLGTNYECVNKKECRKTMDASDKRTQENWHKLWKYLDDNLRKWWD